MLKARSAKLDGSGKGSGKGWRVMLSMKATSGPLESAHVISTESVKTLSMRSMITITDKPLSSPSTKN